MKTNAEVFTDKLFQLCFMLASSPNKSSSGFHEEENYMDSFILCGNGYNYIIGENEFSIRMQSHIKLSLQMR